MTYLGSDPLKTQMPVTNTGQQEKKTDNHKCNCKWKRMMEKKPSLLYLLLMLWQNFLEGALLQTSRQYPGSPFDIKALCKVSSLVSGLETGEIGLFASFFSKTDVHLQVSGGNYFLPRDGTTHYTWVKIEASQGMPDQPSPSTPGQECLGLV